LDTNVVAYVFDPDADQKRERAKAILKGTDWLVSWQVVQEFANLARHRFAVPMKPADLADYLGLVLWPRCRILPSMEIYRAALEIHTKTQYRIYDSLIVASAIVSGAKQLYSEDLQAGRVIGGVEIVNPF
jgi:predicted nucleic acid-binding protein